MDSTAHSLLISHDHDVPITEKERVMRMLNIWPPTRSG